jgi:KaiC/GvpD/RAD55 family RecA-like ATPase
MIKNELISKSPLRILEKSIHGGVGNGNVGVIAAPKGIGKTACLVHIATDSLFQGKHAIHISFCANPDHIVSWYEDIFNEIARRNNLTNAAEIRDETASNRVIMNFVQDDTHIDKIRKNILMIVENGTRRFDTIVVDGYNFSKATSAEFNEFKKLAVENNLEIWFSASIKNDADAVVNESGVPALLVPFISDISILITLKPKGKFVHFTLVKDHEAYTISEDMHLKLDPEILLIAEE